MADRGVSLTHNAVVTISGIELAEKIKKGQFKTGQLGGPKATIECGWKLNVQRPAIGRVIPCKGFWIP